MAGPERPVAWKFADVLPAIATVSTLTRAVSLMRQVLVTIPLASDTEVACVGTPFPDAADQVTVTFGAGWLSSVTLAAT